MLRKVIGHFVTKLRELTKKALDKKYGILTIGTKVKIDEPNCSYVHNRTGAIMEVLYFDWNVPWYRIKVNDTSAIWETQYYNVNPISTLRKRRKNVKI